MNNFNVGEAFRKQDSHIYIFTKIFLFVTTSILQFRPGQGTFGALR